MGISQIENEITKPSLKFLKKLNDVFGISSDYILYGNLPYQTVIELEDSQKENKKGTKDIMIISEAESKYQIFLTATKKLIDNLVEILESKNEVMIDALKANIKAFLEAIRSSQKKDENKGGD